jgi:REP element-mobilizing transposase RayT
LPHIDAGAQPQFLTWRLADSLPASLFLQWKEELAGAPDEERRKTLAKLVNDECDAGRGECVLRQPLVARTVQETLRFDHGRRYDLHAWVVMPNHVHVLLTPRENVTLDEIMRTQKSISSTRINKLLGASGRLWQPDYFDRLIRDEKHFNGVVRYIEWNPVKAKLCADPADWPWSSAYREAIPLTTAD